ncbi:hypothetical protein [Streptomyces sp. HNM0574]|uniref:hypothetical protein n=1 Tax=Streptomyces sp. HNM0574 TaxID=2714954 RepID=UPI00146E94D3|nr:hypothetical protein [Streptomyces sp. HNM0574]NLU69642.1 hypothetical protein [Streptomyces sp. HNM0574]
MTAGADLRLLRAAVFTAACVTLSAAGHALATGGQALPLGSLVTASVLVLAVAVPLAGRERSLPGIAALLTVGQLALHTVFSCGQQAVPRGPQGGSGESREIFGLARQLLCNEHARGPLTEAEARRVVSDAGLSPSAAAGSGSGSGSGGGLDSASAAGGYGAHGGHGAADALAAGDPLACLRHAAHAALSLLDVPMLAGHVLAALVLGWLLRRGESALWRLLRLSARSAAVTSAAELLPVGALRRALAYVRALCAGLFPAAPPRRATVRAGEATAPRPVLLQHAVHRRGPPRRTDHRAGSASAELALAA